jgi:hypothetical protein
MMRYSNGHAASLFSCHFSLRLCLILLENCFCTLAFRGCLIKLNILTQVRSGQSSQRLCISGKTRTLRGICQISASGTLSGPACLSRPKWRCHLSCMSFSMRSWKSLKKARSSDIYHFGACEPLLVCHVMFCQAVLDIVRYRVQ